MIALLRSVAAVLLGYIVFAASAFAVFRLSGQAPHEVAHYKETFLPPYIVDLFGAPATSSYAVGVSAAFQETIAPNALLKLLLRPFRVTVTRLWNDGQHSVYQFGQLAEERELIGISKHSREVVGSERAR